MSIETPAAADVDDADTNGPVDTARRGAAQVVAGSVWTPLALLFVPYAIAIVRSLTQSWHPVLDLTMTELRVRDVGTGESPLIGLAGRIGDFPDIGSHPGPLSFYLLAPVYRVLGSSAEALLVGALVISAAAAVAVVLVARRIGGLRVQWAVTVLLLVLLQGYSFEVIGQPWNPYIPVVPWIATLVAVWAVFAGDNAVLWVATLAGTLSAQTHLPYVGLAGSIVLIATGLVGWRWWRAAPESDQRRAAGRDLVIGVSVGVVCWLPVALDQLFGSRNLTRLVDHFGTPPEDPIGGGTGFRVFFRHLDPTAAFDGWGDVRLGAFGATGGDLSSPVLPGVILFVAWAVAAVWSVLRIRDRRVLALHAVVGAGAALGLFSMSRIFGKVWYYLTLWAWSVMALMVLATLWTLLIEVRRRLTDERSRRRVDTVGLVGLAVVGSVAWSALVVQAVRLEVPQERLSRALGAVVGPTADAIRDGVAGVPGEDGAYTVLWDDSFFFGSQGTGAVGALERDGLDARVSPPWRVPMTSHRVLEIADADRVILVATGAYIDRWRAEPAATEVTVHELRSEAELAEFDRLRTQLVTGLEELDVPEAELAELLTMVDFNLFGLLIEPEVGPDLQVIVSDMLELGQEIAVFFVPPEVFVGDGTS